MSPPFHVCLQAPHLTFRDLIFLTMQAVLTLQAYLVLSFVLPLVPTHEEHGKKSRCLTVTKWMYSSSKFPSRNYLTQRPRILSNSFFLFLCCLHYFYSCSFHISSLFYAGYFLIFFNSFVHINSFLIYFAVPTALALSLPTLRAVSLLHSLFPLVF